MLIFTHTNGYRKANVCCCCNIVCVHCVIVLVHQMTSVDQLAMHFSLDGSMIYIDSQEIKYQLTPAVCRIKGQLTCYLLNSIDNVKHRSSLFPGAEGSQTRPAPDQSRIHTTRIITMFTSYQFPPFLWYSASDLCECRHFKSVSDFKFC